MRLRRHGWSRAEVAEALEVAPEGVSRRMGRVRHGGGPEALRARPGPGAPPKLTPEQLRATADDPGVRLARGRVLPSPAESYGSGGDVWTCGRVAAVIAEGFGVRYHKGHVGRLLKALRRTPQAPIRRAPQRDGAAITSSLNRRRRVGVWPGLFGRARRQRRTVVFEGESGFYPSTCCPAWCGRTRRRRTRRCCGTGRRATPCR